MIRTGRATARQTAQKPATYKPYTIPAPTLGIIANVNPAQPPPGGALILENFIPRATDALLRRGSQLYQIVSDGVEAVTSLFTYKNGNNERLFAATATTISDISTKTPQVYFTDGLGNRFVGGGSGESLIKFIPSITRAPATITGLTGGDWSVVQFATPGGVFLDMVNGSDTKQIYDGTNFYPISGTSLYAFNYTALLSPPTNGALSATAAGTLAATTYYVRSTWVNTLGETLGAAETSLAVAVNNVLNVAAPASPPYGATGWNVYVSTTAGTETKQNGATPIALATAWVEPTTGLVAGAALPAANTAQTAAFTVGKTLTGQTSAATATIAKVINSGTTGTLWINNVTGTFQTAEIIHDNNTPTQGSATSSGTPALLFGAMTGVDLTTLSYNWTHQQRLFYIQKNSLNAWYLPAASISGAAVQLPLGGVFNLGGSLLFGTTWSLEVGAGGLQEQCAFVTTEGEVVVYQGTDPSAASTWSKVGVYRIGKPLGPNAHFRAGGDIVIATDIGLVPLSSALQKDFSVLSPSAVSAPIETVWNDEVAARFGATWRCQVWSANQIAIVNPPTVNNLPPVLYVANLRTGAWGKFTGWDSRCMAVFQNRLFFGSGASQVIEANVTGTDMGQPFTGVYVPLFSDFGAPTTKTAGMTRAVLQSFAPLNEQISMHAEFDVNLPASPPGSIAPTSNVWDGGVWGAAIWGQSLAKTTSGDWHSTPNTGNALAPALQITSGSIVPLDVKILRTDVTYTMGDLVT